MQEVPLLTLIDQFGGLAAAAPAAGPSESCKAFCASLADLFKVRTHEVGLLGVKASRLEFLHPFELRQAGSIPLSSNAVAARVATANRAQLWNDFVTVPHWSVFETVCLHEPSDQGAQVIQKLMAAPVVSPMDGEVVGVVQICRKGPGRNAAGPDFTATDLERLRVSTWELGLTMRLLLAAEGVTSGALSVFDRRPTPPRRAP